MPRLLQAPLLLLLLVSCRTVGPPAPVGEAPATPAPLPPGIDAEALDPAVDPCEDFYQYACGGWLARADPPVGEPAWSRGFDTVAEQNARTLRALLEEAAADRGGAGPSEREVLATFWGTCMDEAALEGSLPQLQEVLAPLAALRRGRHLAPVLGALHARGLPGLFRLAPTREGGGRVALGLTPDGLGLPDRDYYLTPEPTLVAVRQAYEASMRRTFELLGDRPARAALRARQVMRLETALARASPPRQALRTGERQAEVLALAELRAATPDFGWRAYLAAAGASHVHALSVPHPSYLEALARVARRTRPEVLRSYLRWHAVRTLTPALPRRFREAAFRLSAAHLVGVEVEVPRWRTCVALADAALGEPLGRAFAARTLGEEGQRRSRQLVQALLRTLAHSVEGAGWMDGPTRAQARAKVEQLRARVAAPEGGPAGRLPAVDRASFLRTWVAARAVQVAEALARIGIRGDPGPWPLTPATADAAYVPARNELLLPAGLLQPPFFHPRASEAVNYGALGMVVGHELTHALDGTGRRFDALGRPTAWASGVAEQGYAERARCVQRQVERTRAAGGLPVDGARTLGESLADLGGLQLAWEALARAHEGRVHVRGPWHLTPAQSFFVGYAQAWCSKAHPEEARVRALTSPSAPPDLRVNLPLRNLPAFQEAFQCRPGQGMVRPAAERCAVW